MYREREREREREMERGEVTKRVSYTDMYTERNIEGIVTHTCTQKTERDSCRDIWMYTERDGEGGEVTKRVSSTERNIEG